MGKSEHIFIRACKRENTPRTPVWIMRQAGRYLPEYRKIREKSDFLTMCKTPELASEVTVQPVDIIGVDAAILFSDILVVPEAMGMKLELIESVGPKFADPVRNESQVQDLKIPFVEDKLSFVLEAIKLTKKRLDGCVPLIGFCGSPWTLATYMVEGGGTKDFKFIKGLIYSDPALAHRLLDKLSSVLTEYLNAKIKAGCDAVQIFDTWGGILTPWDYKEFSLKYIKKIISGLNTNGAPVIVFSRGANHSLVDIAKSGCDVVSVDWTISLKKARKKIGHKVAIQGNMEPLILNAPHDKIRTEVAKILKQYGKGPGHIFNLGHGITPEVPVENVKYSVNTVKELSSVYHNETD